MVVAIVPVLVDPWEFNIQLQRTSRGSLEFNTQLKSMSNELMGVQYSTTEHVRQTHWSLIINSRACPVGLIFNYGGFPVGP
jgi:hypothetical protein